MKIRLLLPIATTACMLAAPAFAQTTGTIAVNATHSEVDFGSFDGDDDSYGVSGGVSIPASGSLAVLLDASFSHADEADTDVLAGTAHLISRNDNRAFGGFVGLADVDDENAYVVGGEYAAFMTNSTLALGGGYGNLDDSDVDLWGVNGEYRYFLNDNLRFDGGLGWTRAEAGGGDADVLSVGVGFEWRLPSSPVSIGANYVHAEADDFDISSDSIGITARFDFGNGSLKARDRTGNTFGTFGGLGSALSLF